MARRPMEAAPAPSLQGDKQASVLPEWMAQVADGVQPDRALALIGLGLIGRLGADPQGPWIWNGEEEGGSADLTALRQRLELVDLALRTSAPLSTAEVSQLMGARPGAAVVERGGLVARRLGRNVWKLSRSEEPSERSSGSFQESWRRRL
jgi:hypothetical protein